MNGSFTKVIDFYFVLFRQMDGRIETHWYALFGAYKTVGHYQQKKVKMFI